MEWRPVLPERDRARRCSAISPRTPSSAITRPSRVLTDVTAEWPCRARWSLDFFAREHGDLEGFRDGRKRRCERRCGASSGSRSRGDAEASAARDPAGRPGARCRTCERGTPRTIEPSEGFRTIRLLSRLFQMPADVRPPFTWLFLVQPLRLHVDVWHTDAWLTMIRGSKKFVMFHPVTCR